jgi:hypothetical protein
MPASAGCNFFLRIRFCEYRSGMSLLSAALTLCLFSYVEGSGRFPAFLVGGWRERGIGAVVDDDDLTDISLFSVKKSSLWGEKNSSYLQ